LPIIVLLFYAPESSIVVLEQPEIHLHPSVQAGLADVIIDAVKRRGIQVVLESHSEHLLQRLQRRIAEEEIPQEDVALYFSDFSGDQSTLTDLEMDLFGNIKNWPSGFFGDPMAEVAAMSRAVSARKLRAGKVS
jgi:predicted ATPase